MNRKNMEKPLRSRIKGIAITAVRYFAQASQIIYNTKQKGLMYKKKKKKTFSVIDMHLYSLYSQYSLMKTKLGICLLDCVWI